MNSYQVLASYYDRFTDDVGYAAWADYFEEIFRREGVRPHFLVDLACGTGPITALMAARGYEVLGVDASAEMLTQAAARVANLSPRPLLVQQRMEQLELGGTADAFLCCLDSVNYVTDPAALQQTFCRVFQFLEAGGIFVFDVNTPLKFQKIAGNSYVREDGDVYCVWQCLVDGTLCTYDFDIFECRDGKNWRRSKETHRERIYPPERLRDMLLRAGFSRIRCYPALDFGVCSGQEDRIFFTAVRK